MTIQEIRDIVVNKIKVLQQQKADYYNSGDLEMYAKVEAELTETVETLNQL